MSNYEDDQSEDGELASSPMQDILDFSLSDEHDTPDSLDIKPPQASIRPSHKESRKGHKRSGRDRHKDMARREKKHSHRDRDKNDKAKREEFEIKNQDRETNNPREYYKEKLYYREKKEKELPKEKHQRDGYRDNKEFYREKEIYRDSEPYRDRDAYREKEPYRQRDTYREKESLKDKELQRQAFIAKERERDRQMETERNQRFDSERRNELRSRNFPEKRSSRQHEKENKDRDQSSGDKELEDLRSRLLSKRINKEHRVGLDSQQHDSKQQSESGSDREGFNYRNTELDRNQEDRKNKFIAAEREMARRKESSRAELEARRKRRRGKKRSVTPAEEERGLKKRKSLPLEVEETEDDVIVTLSDTSDIEMKSPESVQSDQEEGEHSGSETESESSSADSESESASASNSEDQEEADKSPEKKSDIENEEKAVESPKPKSLSASPVSVKSAHSRSSPLSQHSQISRRSKSRSRSRSHSFSPPPPDRNGEAQPEPEEPTTAQIDDRNSSLPSYFPALQGCRSVEEFQCLNRIEEGTYGVVYRARDKTTDEIVALKRLKMEKEKEGFPITSLREINTLLKGQYPNIVTVREIVVGSNMDKIFIVMDYVEHDLKSLMETMRGKKQVFLPGEVKCLMQQLLKAVHHLHDNWILHRDLKTSNLLLSHKGILKVGDFGLAREYGSPLRQYTPIVVTLWYRAPELLLCCKEYSTPIDMWSVGCIFAELITMNPLFPGKSEVDQLNRIFKDLGTPSEAVWSGYSQLPAVQKMTFAEHPAGGLRARAGADLLSDLGLALLQGMLTYDPARRLTADTALTHAYFKEQPVAIEPAMFPTWPAKSEGGRRAAVASPKPPSGGGHYKLLEREDAAPAFQLSGVTRSLNMGPGFSLKF